MSGSGELVLSIPPSPIRGLARIGEPTVDQPDLGDQSSASDNIVQQEATINPAILEGPLVNGRPPGYLSEGDRIVLERYRGLNESRLDIHDSLVCPECWDNGNGK